MNVYMGSIAGIISAYPLGYIGSLINEYGSASSAAAEMARRMQDFQMLYPVNMTAAAGWGMGVLAGVAVYFMMKTDTERNYSYAKEESGGTADFMNKTEMAEYIKTCTEPEMNETRNKNGRTIKHRMKPEYIAVYKSPNMILGDGVVRSINDMRTHLNNNVLVMGGAGTGKSRFFVKPNILQMNASFVTTDPSGEILASTGKALIDHGYKIKVFNIANMRYSNCYNPLHLIRDEAGVLMAIDCFIRNTTSKYAKSDEFFTNAERLLYSACIFYLINNCHDETKRNMATVLDMINSSAIDENNLNAKSKLDELFDCLPQNEIAWKYYKAFKQASGKALKSIVISCVTRLQPFMTQPVINLTKTDDLELDMMGDEKMALFIITPQADKTFNFLSSMLYAQLFETLYWKGEQRKASGGSERSKYHVRCLMDEFANIGEIPEMPSKLATMRKYNISATIILQDKSQIEAMYKDEWKTMVANCDTMVFLGSSEMDTLKYISEKIGDKTIIVKSRSSSKGGKGGSSQSMSETKRPVMTPEELQRMKFDECIIFNRTKRAIFARKFVYENHPLFEQTADANPDNAFLYTKISAFDNTRIPGIGNLILGFKEAARAEEQDLCTDFSHLEREETDKTPSEYMDGMCVGEGLEGKAIIDATRECIKLVENDHTPLPIVYMENVKKSTQEQIVRQTYVMCGEPVMLFINNGDERIYGLCVDSSEAEVKEWFAEYCTDEYESGGMVSFSIPKDRLDEYKAFIYAQLPEYVPKTQDRFDQHEKAEPEEEAGIEGPEPTNEPVVIPEISAPEMENKDREEPHSEDVYEYMEDEYEEVDYEMAEDMDYIIE